MARYSRLLLTGAAGNLGTVLRSSLKPLCDTLRVSDIRDLGPAGDSEETVTCDLGDAAGMLGLTKDVDAVVHMGGVASENTFERLLHGNIRGLYNLYEGCRKNRVSRVVWASSNHAVGFYPREQTLDASVRQRPDTNYGLTKAFGENLAQYYFDKYGVESVSLRIGSCFEEPTDRRMLATWLSYRDLSHLVERSLVVPRTGHTIVYGMSANDEVYWDNRMARSLGYRPRDNAESHRARLEKGQPSPDPDEPLFRWHGGTFAGMGHVED